MGEGADNLQTPPKSVGVKLRRNIARDALWIDSNLDLILDLLISGETSRKTLIISKLWTNLIRV